MSGGNKLGLWWVVAALSLSLSLAGCVAHGHARASAHVSPVLVHVGNGVWVVEDYDRPVFYADGWYWLYTEHSWMRSHTYTGGFVHVDASVVPRVVVKIDRPKRYIHYEARADSRTREAPVRDHRTRKYNPGHHGKKHERDHRGKKHERDHRGKKHERDHRGKKHH